MPHPAVYAMMSSCHVEMSEIFISASSSETLGSSHLLGHTTKYKLAAKKKSIDTLWTKKRTRDERMDSKGITILCK